MRNGTLVLPHLLLLVHTVPTVEALQDLLHACDQTDRAMEIGAMSLGRMM